MPGTEERISTLETRVVQLETWAGPGQIEVLAAGMRGIRADIAVMRRVQDRHTAQLNRLTGDVGVLQGDVAGLKSDVAELKSDVAELKLGMREVLRRLPEAPASR
ncbi:MAG TPA: hypothetical protein VGI58_08235 [Streptosporangiaceae bacterium]|jgi:uncharacterized coiled-coil protein SlyX